MESINKFDLAKFDADFDKLKINNKMIGKIKSENTLKELSEKSKKIQINYNNFLINVLMNIKISWLSLINDLLEQHYSDIIFLKDDRMLYIGLSIIIISILLLFLDNLD
jgi:hypothetical protein